MQIIHENEYEETMKNTVDAISVSPGEGNYMYREQTIHFVMKTNGSQVRSTCCSICLILTCQKVWWSSVTVLQNPQRNTMKWLTIF